MTFSQSIYVVSFFQHESHAFSVSFCSFLKNVHDWWQVPRCPTIWGKSRVIIKELLYGLTKVPNGAQFIRYNFIRHGIAKGTTKVLLSLEPFKYAASLIRMTCVGRNRMAKHLMGYVAYQVSGNFYLSLFSLLLRRPPAFLL